MTEEDSRQLVPAVICEIHSQAPDRLADAPEFGGFMIPGGYHRVIPDSVNADSENVFFYNSEIIIVSGKRH